MSQKRNYKICLIGESLANGGAEKSMALLSRFFTSKGIETHLVIVLDQVVYDFSGELLNLGKLKNKSNGFFNKLRRLLVLRNYLRRNRFDYIIDFRIRVSFVQEYLIAKWLYDAPAVYTVHSSMTGLYFPESRKQAQKIYKDAFAIVTVSGQIGEIVNEKYGLRNTTTIHNPIDIDAIRQAADAFKPIEDRYILAAGRMKDNVKQFNELVSAFGQTSLPAKGIKLVILGDGPDRNILEKGIENSGLSDSVILKGHVENPYPYMKNALFFVLSSKREGLPTVILESLACGIPVVSFDCVSGPAEMIADRKNGLVVADQNFDKLAHAMESLVADDALYQNCRNHAAASAQAFSLENIGRQWLEFLKIDVS